MKNRKVWDKIARDYGGYRRKLWEPVIDFLDSSSGLTLDVGCGGFPTRDYAENIIGLDVSLEQLKLGEGRRVQGKAESLPFQSKAFSSVLLVASLHNIRNREKALEEAKRVLKSKGNIFISVWSRFQLKFFPKNLFTKEFEIPFGDYKRYYHLFTKSELKKLVESKGFDIEKIWKEKNNIFVKGTKSGRK